MNTILVGAHAAMLTITDSLAVDLPEPHKKALHSIEKLIDAQLTVYAGLKDNTEKIAFGKSLLNCMQTNKELALLVAKEPEYWKEIPTVIHR